VPQVSGINIAESVSMTFFALTFFNVAMLIFFYEIVSYGMSSAIWCFRLVSILYGLVIIALAICAIVLEDQKMDEIGDQVWAALSSNQKDFFKNSVGNLKAERRENNLFVGLFSIVIGLCFIVIGALMYKLNQLQAPEIVKQVTARLPPMGHNERVDFLGYTYITNELEDSHHISLKPYYPKVSKKRANATMGGAL